MKNIAVIGYGVIGKRVADAINLQEDSFAVGWRNGTEVRRWQAE